VWNQIFSLYSKLKLISTLEVKSTLNVSVIKNASDNMQFLHIIDTNICFCPLANISATLMSTY